jgi:predicted Rossmann fold nucleotide-binding protein DprA/Smf involved in DNA uptake
LVLRAGENSGSFYTATAAVKQGRPVWAIPGELHNDRATGCNTLIAQKVATLCLSAQHLLESLRKGMPEDCRVAATEQNTEEAKQPIDRMSGLSDHARLAYQALGPSGNSFEEVLCSLRLPAAALTTALCELELSGLVLSRPGRRFEKL